MSAETNVIAEEAQTEVSALRARAIEHKQAAQKHRRASRACMEQIAQIKARCAAVGIHVEPEATSHGHRSNTRT